jgi:hypothetical protein
MRFSYEARYVGTPSTCTLNPTCEANMRNHAARGRSRSPSTASSA